MQVLNIAEVGEVKIRKLSKRDYELLRNNCLDVDKETKQEKINSGSFIKYLCIFGIDEAPFFKSKYPENTRISGNDFIERENEYYDSDVPQNVFDKLYIEIQNHNQINNQEVKEVSKE